MDSLREHAVPLISVLVFANVAGFRWIWSNITKTMDAHGAKLEKYFELHSECQKLLPEKYAKNSDLVNICNKLDKLNDFMASLPLIYRTKEEANKDWRDLEGRLAELKSLLQTTAELQNDNYNKLWDKLNRVVDEFRNSRNMIMDRQGKIEECVFTSREQVEMSKRLREKLALLTEDGHVETNEVDY